MIHSESFSHYGNKVRCIFLHYFYGNLQTWEKFFRQKVKLSYKTTYKDIQQAGLQLCNTISQCICLFISGYIAGMIIFFPINLLTLHRNSSGGNPIYKVLYKLLSIHLVKSNPFFNSLGRAIRDLFFPHSTFMSCPFRQTWFSSSKFCVSQESEHESLSP